MHTGKSTKRGINLRNKAIWPCLSQDLNPISNPSGVGFKINLFAIGSIRKKLLKHILQLKRFCMAVWSKFSVSQCWKLVASYAKVL